MEFHYQLLNRPVLNLLNFEYFTFNQLLQSEYINYVDELIKVVLESFKSILKYEACLNKIHLWPRKNLLTRIVINSCHYD